MRIRNAAMRGLFTSVASAIAVAVVGTACTTDKIAAPVANATAMFAAPVMSSLIVNHPPVAEINTLTAAAEGTTLTFNAQGSQDQDGDALTYAWNFGDGGTTTGVFALHTYDDNGVYTVTLVVTDPYGATGTATTTITIANVAPNILSLWVPSTAQTAGVAPSATLAFNDPGAADTHVVTFYWGDGTSTTLRRKASRRPCTRSRRRDSIP